jgi:hypothetical protein
VLWSLSPAALRGGVDRNKGGDLCPEHGQRFVIDPAQLKASVTSAVGDAFARGSAPEPEGDVERQEMETRLIAKLQAAGQLRPSYLLKALRDGKLYLFELALASLAHLRTDDVRAACASDRPELVALACAGVGIDRSVFPTILSLLRALNDGRPTACEDSLRNINSAFTYKTPQEALAVFRAEIAALVPVDSTAQRGRA